MQAIRYKFPPRELVIGLPAFMGKVRDSSKPLKLRFTYKPVGYCGARAGIEDVGTGISIAEGANTLGNIQVVSPMAAKHFEIYVSLH